MKFLENNTKTATISSILPSEPWLVLGFSERRHGNMHRGSDEAPQNVLRRAQFAFENDIVPDKIIAPVLVHGADVKVVGQKDFDLLMEADALVTKEPEVYLSVTTADCLPVYFIDYKKRIIGLAHAGWRGILRGVLGNTIATMKKAGADPNKIMVGIGPHIGACHYSVDLPRAKKFQEIFGNDVVTRRSAKYFLDLERSATRSLGRAGIMPSNVKSVEVCTYCDERYFSYRRDSFGGVQAMMAVAGIVE